jgi:hypothetical protein
VSVEEKAFGDQPVREEAGLESRARGGREEQELGAFLARAVTRGTRNGYATDWKNWVAFVGRSEKSDRREDVYLDKAGSDTEKASALALFFKERYEEGMMRGRQATCASAGIRHHFIAALREVGWFESQIVSSARAACRLSCEEIRTQKKEASKRVMLPVSEDMLLDARKRLWEGKSWEWGDIDERMTYLGLMWGFDQVARVSEYTAAETSAEDHCIQVWQLSFITEEKEGGQQRVVAGAGIARVLEANSGSMVVACEVEASSHKGGALSKKKLIGRRSKEESQWLDDLVEWLVNGKLAAEDLVFTRYKAKSAGGKIFRKRLSAEMIRSAVKVMAEVANLPPERFSAHSLRKGGISQMRGLGASSDDRRDRGNYSDGSKVFDTIYDYAAVALGPLACNLNVGVQGMVKPSVEHVGRCLPTR